MPSTADQLAEASNSDEQRAKARLLNSPLHLLRSPSINFEELEKTYQEVTVGKEQPTTIFDCTTGTLYYLDEGTKCQS